MVDRAVELADGRRGLAGEASTTPWRKVLRDVWQERTRSALVVLAIALGIAGFDAVLSAYAILTRELNEGYLASQPGLRHPVDRRDRRRRSWRGRVRAAMCACAKPGEPSPAVSRPGRWRGAA